MSNESKQSNIAFKISAENRAELDRLQGIYSQAVGIPFSIADTFCAAVHKALQLMERDEDDVPNIVKAFVNPNDLVATAQPAKPAAKRQSRQKAVEKPEPEAPKEPPKPVCLGTREEQVANMTLFLRYNLNGRDFHWYAAPYDYLADMYRRWQDYHPESRNMNYTPEEFRAFIVDLVDGDEDDTFPGWYVAMEPFASEGRMNSPNLHADLNGVARSAKAIPSGTFTGLLKEYPEDGIPEEPEETAPKGTYRYYHRT